MTIAAFLIPASALHPWIVLRQVTLTGGGVMAVIWYFERKGTPVIYRMGYRRGERDARREHDW